MKYFKIGFIGTNNFTVIIAKTQKEAKQIFAAKHNCFVSSYIICKRN